MNEEIRNNETLDTVENIDEVNTSACDTTTYDYEGHEECSEDDSGLGRTIRVVGLIGIGVGITARLIWINRHKVSNFFDERNAERLRKKGYEVYKVDDIEQDDVDDENIVDIESKMS